MAVPSSNGPIVLDMATSTISNGKILLARATNEKLPAETVLTAAGEATTDPGAAEILLPLGGAKGSGLSFMIEMLASVLGAAPIQARVLGPEQRKRHTANMAVIAIDVAAFRPPGEFVSDADMLAALIKTLPRQAGFDEILLPGERSGRTEAQRRKSGIPVPGKLWDELEALAKPQSIRMPERPPAR
jgi:ureidoglycolate dehydrogenase (NAD+)